jgi:hypothetical protein
MGLLGWASIAVFVIGLWIGAGAPGWPYQGDGKRRHTTHRNVNPIAWGRTSSRERQRPKSAGERRINLRG